MPSFLNIRKVAEICGLSRDTIRNLYKTGRFTKPIKVGASIRWDAAQFDRFIAEKQAEASNDSR